MDPLVAMLLSVWLIYAWGGQAYLNVMNLVGLSASPQFLQKLTYLCWNHDPRILQIDTVRWAVLQLPSPVLSHHHRLLLAVCRICPTHPMVLFVLANHYRVMVSHGQRPGSAANNRGAVTSCSCSSCANTPCLSWQEEGLRGVEVGGRGEEGVERGC